MPVTFAYVIIVQRALDVRVVLRQGLQYTLASRGIIVLQLVLSIALFVFAWELATSRSVSALVPVATIAAGVAILLLLQGGRKRLALWIDRRFFRDAYDAEQILNDLSDQVRTIVEIKPLLEVVAGRIASSLHIKELAVLLKENELYHPCYAIGFDCLPEVTLPADAATIQLLRSEKQPTRVYVDDPNSWLNRPGIQQGEQRQVALLKPERLLPLSAKDELLGFMSLGQKLSGAPFSSTDLRLLRSVGTQTGLALEVARLTTAIGQEIASRERLNRELEIAREVQEHLFPQAPSCNRWRRLQRPLPAGTRSRRRLLRLPGIARRQTRCCHRRRIRQGHWSRSDDVQSLRFLARPSAYHRNPPASRGNSEQPDL